MPAVVGSMRSRAETADVLYAQMTAMLVRCDVMETRAIALEERVNVLERDLEHTSKAADDNFLGVVANHQKLQLLVAQFKVVGLGLAQAIMGCDDSLLERIMAAIFGVDELGTAEATAEMENAVDNGMAAINQLELTMINQNYADEEVEVECELDMLDPDAFLDAALGPDAEVAVDLDTAMIEYGGEAPIGGLVNWALYPPLAIVTTGPTTGPHMASPW